MPCPCSLQIRLCLRASGNLCLEPIPVLVGLEEGEGGREEEKEKEKEKEEETQKEEQANEEQAQSGTACLVTGLSFTVRQGDRDGGRERERERRRRRAMSSRDQVLRSMGHLSTGAFWGGFLEGFSQKTVRRDCTEMTLW